MKPFLIAAMLLVLAVGPVHAFTAQNGMVVTRGSDADFIVQFDAVPRETDYLCAAGDFVMRGLGLPSKTRLFRASLAPRQQGQGIRFTIDPTRMVKMGLFTSFGAQATDGGISAGAATGSYCDRILLFPFK